MAAGGGHALTEENKNFTRLSLLVIKLGTEAVREVFDRIPIFGPKVLSKNLELNRTSNEMRAVPPFLRKILYPVANESKVMKSSEFDLTMMCALMDKLYTPTQTTVAVWNATNDIINEIKRSRNRLAHSDASVSDQDFDEIWRDTSTAILSLADAASEPIYRQKIQHLLQMTIDDGDFNTTLADIVRIRADIDRLIEDGTQIHSTLDQHASQITGLQDTHIQHGSTLERHASQITRLEDRQIQHGSRLIGNGTTVIPPDTTVIPRGYGIRLQQELKKCYRQNMAHISCNPLNPAATQPISSLYVKLLCMVQEDLNYPAGQEMKMKELQHYRDIFVDQSKKRPRKQRRKIRQRKEKKEKKEKKVRKDILRILVQGCPGVGKTTFAKRVAVDWAEGKEPMLLDRFENVFVLTLRQVQPHQTLVDVISEQLLPHKSPLVHHLKTYIENNSRCMFLFDGLDEMKPNTSKDIDEMIQRRHLKNTCLVITSRPSESQYLITPSKIDQLARLEGFTYKDVQHFIAKFFGERLNTLNNLSRNSSGAALMKAIRQKGLSDIAKIPLILNILCLLYRQEKSLPTNMSKIYLGLQQSICKRQKYEKTENEANLEHILLKLGKIAFEGLLKENNQLFFSKKHILEEVGEDAFKVGLIWIEKAKYESKYNAFFLHKSFQEKSAASYLDKETDSNNDEPWEKLKNKLKTIEDIGEQDLLLQFCAGASHRLAEQTLNFLDEKVDEINPKLKIVLQAMKKLSQNKNLEKQELETVCNYDYFIGYHIKQILELEAKCLSNVENPTEIRSHAVNQVIIETENMKKARERKILKPEKCIVLISNDKELVDLVNSTTSVSWIKLEGKPKIPYSFTEKTVELLQEICNRNEHQVSVFIGKYCTADRTAMLKVLQLLKSNTKIKYKIFTFNGIKYGREGWEKVFQILSGIRYLIALNLGDCGIPITVLATIGQIINENADTLLQLGLGKNEEIRNHFGELSKNVENQLSLTVLNLFGSLYPSDTVALRGLLQKCEHTKVLDVGLCKCEISEDIYELEHIKEVNLGRTVDKFTKEGLDVGQVLANLDKVEMLEVINANNCLIDDAQIQTIPFNNPSKIREINLSDNRIGRKGLQYLCEHHAMLQELEEIRLHHNKIGDEGGKVLMEHLQLFKKMRMIWVSRNEMSAAMNRRIKQKGLEYGITCDTD